jgi:hypothetical protein
MKRGMIAMSAVMAMGMANLLMADNMGERFTAHPKYAEYLDINKTNRQEAILFSRQMYQEICDQIFLQVEAECNSLAKKGVRARYEKWDLQTKVNFTNLYLKSKKVLAKEEQRATFIPNLSTYLERIYFHTGTTLDKAQEIKEKFVFNDGNTFIDHMIEIAKMADETAEMRKEIAEKDKVLAEWDKIIKRLEKLGQ